jgi:hypothetical protein
MSDGDYGWDVNRKLILDSIDRLRDELAAIKNKLDQFRQDDIAQIRTEIALLKVKSSMWGAAMGAATGIAVALTAAIFKGLK